MTKLLAGLLGVLIILGLVALILGLVFVCGNLVQMIIDVWKEFQDGEW